MKQVSLLTILFILWFMTSCQVKENYADYVDTSVGVTDNRASNCVIGPQLPYGSINPSPQTESGNDKIYYENISFLF